MYSFLLAPVSGTVVALTTSYAFDQHTPAGFTWVNRNDYKSLDEAQRVAGSATRTLKTDFMAVDNGPSCSPRYDVIRTPQVGDEVSQAFNGDYYPEGVITKITHKLRRIETSTGEVFWRRKDSGSWLNGGFSMIRGHVSRLSREF